MKVFIKIKVLLLFTIFLILNQITPVFSGETHSDYIKTIYCAPLELNRPSEIYLVAPNQFFSLNLQNQLFLSPLGDYITFSIQNLAFESGYWINYQQNILFFSGIAPSRGSVPFIITASNACSNITLNIRIEVANEPPSVTFLMKSITYQQRVIFCESVQISDPNRDTWTLNIQPQDKTIDSKIYEFWIDEKLLCGRINYDKEFKLDFTISDKEFSLTKSLLFEPTIPDKDESNIIELYGEPICVKAIGIINYKLKMISVDDNDAQFAEFDPENGCLRIEPHTRNAFPIQMSIQYTGDHGNNLIKSQKLITRNTDYVMPFSQEIMQFSIKNNDNYITILQGFTKDEHIYLISKDLDNFIVNIVDKYGNSVFEYFKQDVFPQMIPTLMKGYPIENNNILVLVQNGFINPTELFYLLYTPKGLVQNVPTKILDENHLIISTCLVSNTELMIASIVSNDQKKYQLNIILYDFEKGTKLKSQIITELAYLPTKLLIEKLSNGEYAILVSRNMIEIFFIKDFSEGVKKEILPIKTEKVIWTFEFAELENHYVIFWIENFFTYALNSEYTIGVESIPKKLFDSTYRHEVKTYTNEIQIFLGLTKIDNMVLLYTEFILPDQVSPDLDTFLFDSSGNLMPSNFMIQRPTLEKIIYTTDIAASKNLILYSWISPIIDNDLQNLILRIAIYPCLIKKNYVPDVLGSLTDLDIKSGDSFYYYIPEGLFADYDGEPLTYSIASNKEGFDEWVQFDKESNLLKGSTRTFSSEEYNISIIAKDPYNSKAEAILTLRVTHDTKRYWAGFLMLLGIMIAFIFMTKNFIISRFRNEDEIEHQNLHQFELSSLDSTSSPANRIKPEDLEILIAQSSSDKIPGMYLCPITGEIMADPWILISTDENSSHSYEREAIESWMVNHDTDPLTRQKRKFMGRNNNLRNAIEHFLLHLSVEDMRTDAGLRNEIRNWIRRRGGEQSIMSNTQLVPILERLRESEDLPVSLDNDKQPEKAEDDLKINENNS